MLNASLGRLVTAFFAESVTDTSTRMLLESSFMANGTSCAESSPAPKRTPMAASTLIPGFTMTIFHHKQTTHGHSTLSCPPDSGGQFACVGRYYTARRRLWAKGH